MCKTSECNGLVSINFVFMTLIKSISGIRGTIGGKVGDNLTPPDIVRFIGAYAEMIKDGSGRPKVVVGRDARVSGPMVNLLVTGTLVACGIDVIDLGLSTTPTVELAVPGENADGGIIITASHNPAQWNALKLLNAKGEFISGAEGEKLLAIAAKDEITYVDFKNIGEITSAGDWLFRHVQMVCDYPLVDINAIRSRGFKVAVDAVNSTGGIAIPLLLQALGITEIVEIFCEPDGNFPHNPEPLPEHLTEISRVVVEQKCDLGIVVDPDVDRLCFVSEDGTIFGEEYTLVAVADYMLSRNKGRASVSNLSSTRALRDITLKHGGNYEASAVGEVNVVEKMKATNALIGGEGNGGVIVPDLHYGRDALIGAGLFLSHLAHSGMKMSEFKRVFPLYEMSKNKIELTEQINVDSILEHLKTVFKNEQLNNTDGLKIDFENGWVHMRKSNTEPIIRLYAEGRTREEAESLTRQVRNEVDDFLNS